MVKHENLEIETIESWHKKSTIRGLVINLTNQERSEIFGSKDDVSRYCKEIFE